MYYLTGIFYFPWNYHIVDNDIKAQGCLGKIKEMREVILFDTNSYVRMYKINIGISS